MTTTNTFARTTRWASPELLEEDTHPTRESDVWAFGCVCYEVCADWSSRCKLLAVWHSNHPVFSLIRFWPEKYRLWMIRRNIEWFINWWIENYQLGWKTRRWTRTKIWIRNCVNWWKSVGHLRRRSVPDVRKFCEKLKTSLSYDNHTVLIALPHETVLVALDFCSELRARLFQLIWIEVRRS
jgi:serine/threonine protein kinase